MILPSKFFNQHAAGEGGCMGLFDRLKEIAKKIIQTIKKGNKVTELKKSKNGKEYLKIILFKKQRKITCL